MRLLGSVGELPSSLATIEKAAGMGSGGYKFKKIYKSAGVRSRRHIFKIKLRLLGSPGVLPSS